MKTFVITAWYQAIKDLLFGSSRSTHLPIIFLIANGYWFQWLKYLSFKTNIVIIVINYSIRVSQFKMKTLSTPIILVISLLQILGKLPFSNKISKLLAKQNFWKTSIDIRSENCKFEMLNRIESHLNLSRCKYYHSFDLARKSY